MRRGICKCIFNVRNRRLIELFGFQAVVQKKEMSERSPRVLEMAGDLSLAVSSCLSQFNLLISRENQEEK